MNGTVEQEKKTVVLPSIAIIAVVATFFLLVFVGASFVIIFGDEIALVLAELLVIVIPLGYMISKKINIRSYVGLDTKPTQILFGIALGVFVLLVDMLVSALLFSIFGPSEAVEETNRLVRNISQSPRGLVLVIATLSLAGICEEFTFRGFLQTAINSKYSAVTAVLVSSLAFGFFHFDPQAIYSISAFIIGLILGLIYHHWRSYTINAVVHATVNLVTLALMLLVV